MKTILVLYVLLSAASASAGELAVGSFSSGDLTGWTTKEFKGRTSYSLVKDNGTTVLKAHSVRSASGLVKEVNLDPRSYPVLRWSWKIQHTLKKEEPGKKSGDDYAARVYVIFPRTFFWRMRAINYVWSAGMPRGSFAPSPFTANSAIVAVESGDEKAGEWLTEERNIYEDYRTIFGEEPPRLGGIAVMSDTDNTGDEVTAWYGDIFIGNERLDTATGTSPPSRDWRNSPPLHPLNPVPP